ncbi:MAG TPA: thermonuclease family protein [Solirubrobacterales bacterium]|nr:thermonuclease family protein [Solirubrobacterales bacterium]
MRRGVRHRSPLIAAVVLILALSRCGNDEGDRGPAQIQDPVTARVTDVVDGDTIEVELPDDGEEDVRYIGIDTPETVKPGEPVECGGPRARDANERLVAGRIVTLRFDAERRDRYDRLLAYVYLPATEPGGRPLFVNAELLRRGLARTLTIPPNDSFAEHFARLAARAGARGRGLWADCPL